MDNLKKGISIAMVILTFVSSLLIVGYIYFKIFNNKFTVDVNFINDQLAVDANDTEDIEKEQYDQGHYWTIEYNYFSNENKNGEVLEEMKFNYFMSTDLLEKDYRATGIQHVGSKNYGPVWFAYHHNWDLNKVVRVDGDNVISINMGSKKFYGNITPISDMENYMDSSLYYYTGSCDAEGNVINYETEVIGQATIGNPLTRDQLFIIKIGDKPYGIKCNKKYIKGGGLNKFEYWYMWTDIFQLLREAAESNSAGQGEFYITIDLSKYFSVYEFDGRKFIEEDVSQKVFNYVAVKINYDKNGATTTDNSIFGIMKGDSEYSNVDLVEFEYDYTRPVYKVTINDFNKRYSEVDDAYYLSLKQEVRSYINERNGMAYIYLDYYTTENIAGFDDYGLENLDIAYIKFDSSTGFFDKTRTITFKETALNHSTVQYIYRNYCTSIIFEGDTPRYHLVMTV